MKTNININGKEVEIELTPEQVKSIQNKTKSTEERIKTFKDAQKAINNKDTFTFIEKCDSTFTHKLMKGLGFGTDYTLYNFYINDREVYSDTFAYESLKIVIEALNEGKKGEYYPYFSNKDSGFSYLVCHYGLAYSHVGSRLKLVSADLAKYAGNQFSQLYHQLMHS